MLRALAIRLLGAILSIGPLLQAVLLLLKFGWKKTLSKKERPLPPKTLLDPRWGEHRYIHLPNLRMHYVEKGDKEKTLMVFLHGFPEFWYSWRYQMEHFSKNYWCVTPDLRGYGDSEKPTGIDQYVIDKLVDDVRNLVQGLGREKCILVGHDWGGGIGYSVCDKYPDLVKAYVACNTCHLGAIEKTTSQGWGQTLKSWYMVFYQCPWIPEIILGLLDLAAFDKIFGDLKNKERVSEEDLEAYKFTYKDKGAFTGPINYYRALLQMPPTSKYPKSRVPVLSVFGTGDPYLAADTIALSAEFTGEFTEEFLEGISHWSMMDDPVNFNRLVAEYLGKKGL